MKKTVIIISSILLVAFAAITTFAWESGMGKGMKGQGFNQGCQGYGGGQGSAISNLSKEQQDQLTDLRQKFIDETYDIRSAKLTSQQKIKMLMETSNPDRTELSRLSQEITDLQKQFRDKKIDFQLSVKKIAPELGKCKGFGQGCGKKAGKGGQRYRQSSGYGQLNMQQ